MSIALPWSEFKAYVAEVGPGRGRVARPVQGVFCDGERGWFNGWRRVLVTLLVDGEPHRPTDWLPLQRVRCAQRPCGRSWTLRPPWLYPHRSLEPDLAETAALTYLAEPQATYRSVAQRCGCSGGTVWLWVGWLASLVTLATLEDPLKQAILHRGLPEALYVDHGAAYRADQFAFACAHLGIRLRHSRPYVSEGRGAIERWNRTVAEQFEPESRALRLPELREIQLRFEAWLEQRYHLTVHEATGQTPLDRFAQPDFTPRYPDPVVVAEPFRVRVRRKVHAKTLTVEVCGFRKV